MGVWRLRGVFERRRSKVKTHKILQERGVEHVQKQGGVVGKRT